MFNSCFGLLSGSARFLFWEFLNLNLTFAVCSRRHSLYYPSIIPKKRPKGKGWLSIHFISFIIVKQRCVKAGWSSFGSSRTAQRSGKELVTKPKKRLRRRLLRLLFWWISNRKSAEEEDQIPCVASFSVWFRSKEKPRNEIFLRSFTRTTFRSLTLVPCSFTRNSAKTLATQAKDPREGQKLSQTSHYD